MTYSCAKCGSVSTIAGKCCGRPMGSYAAVNQASIVKVRANETKTGRRSR